MSLFRKPKKTIQRRVFTENDDDDDDTEPMEIGNAVPIDKKGKKKDKSNKTPKTLLSFDAEEEGEVFQVKKSLHSKKVLRMFEKEKKKKEVKVEKEDSKSKEKTEIITDDFVLVVNSSHKKPPTPPPLILSGRDALCAGKDDLSSEEDEEPHRFNKPDNFKRILESGAIPDAAMIHAARKRRQRARELGDFIPTEEEEPEDKGRLLREDDHEGSDEERIDMDINITLKDQERRREQFLSAQDSDREMDEWEDQQIRKGVTGAAMEAARELLYPVECPPPPNISTQLPIMKPGIPRTPKMIAEKLKEHYEQVNQSKQNHELQLQKTRKDIEEVVKELEDLKMKAPNAADRFRFYQELRGYITDLVECLDEKISIITNLEQRALDIMARKSEWLIERRRQDVRDQAEEVANKGSTFKKDYDSEEKQRRAAEREGRRTRRRRIREAAEVPKHVEGMSSDEEISQQDILLFDKEREQIQTELQEVFEDVIEEYSSTASILIRFEQWRSNDLSAYTEAYATFCLPKVVSPLIRLNLIFWNPLNETIELEKLDWYRTLALYGLHDDETEESLAKDPDISLLPTIIEKIIIPKLTQLVDKCWDPLSSSQTLRLVGVISRYIRRFPTLSPASKSLNNLFSAVLHKIKTALEHDVFIPITPKLADNKSPFFQRQFASGLKLLKNITSWQGILNDNTLKELALTSLLDRYLLSSLKFCTLVDAVQKVRLISLILPRIWLQGGTPEFKNFLNSVMNLHQQLDKNNPLHLEPIDVTNSILKTLRSHT
ncbi:PAX3- and PAX7-binding protein 1 isoform X2 [Diorhabda carinulata]|uniref:PAX3- and PAX7-binding protein 1 isoform X2 n=1 Tax=Diorhabda carinulata TaxID=1163345 RepID=UPI0025A0B0FF|nr:PAX3- and PAX7-binding protein 1 isoform X2 [Diorhabda carinulata]